MQKECVDCHNVYDISFFPSFVRPSGKVYILNQCKNCNKKYKQKHYENNKETYKENHKKYEEENIEALQEYRASYRLENEGEIKEYQKTYYQENKEVLNSYKRTYIENRKKNDPVFKLRYNVSKLVSSYLKRSGFRKNKNSILNNIGYSIDELKEHLEAQFEPWMNWDNYGTYSKKTWNDNDQSTWTWQIDHIIPQSTLPYINMEDENFKKCWALKNLKPLSSKQNLLKGNR